MDYVNYRISEANYNRLESAKKQISLITGLLAEQGDADLDATQADELYYFLDAQHSTLKSIVDDIDTFHDVQKEALKNDMSFEMVVDMIQACSGLPVDEQNIIAITEKLTDFAMADSTGGKVIKAFYAALRKAGWDVIQTIKNGEASSSFQLRTQELPLQPTKPAKTKSRKRKSVAA
jgi:hypothetical protein